MALALLLGLPTLPACSSQGHRTLPPPQASPPATAPVPPAASAAPLRIPPARRTLGGLEIVVDMGAADALQFERELSPGQWLLGGAVGSVESAGLTMVQPIYVFGVIGGMLMMVVGPTASAAFGYTQREAAAALDAEAFPQLVLDGIAARLERGRPDDLTHLAMHVAGYGLVPRDPSESPTEFAPGGEVCLVAAAGVIASIGEQPVLAESMAVARGASERSVDAPPPLCASLGRFTADDGRYLRQSVRELAQVLAAMTTSRLESLQ